MDKETNIFNDYLSFNCFCMDIAEAWIAYRKRKGKEVSSDEFMEWVMNDLILGLESNFDDVLEEEFDDIN